MKTFIRLLTLLLLILLASLLGLTYLAREILTPRQAESNVVRVVIARGESVRDIAEMLEEKEVIRHAWSFRVLIRFAKMSPLIKAGTYDLSPSQSAYDILSKLARGEVVKIRITIPEGYTLRQIAELLDSKGIVPKDNFLTAAEQALVEIPEAHLKVRGLEGYLFPDTYDFSPSLTPEEIYEPMVERFKELVLPVYHEGHVKKLRNAVIIASLVEREGMLHKEFPIIAGVYYNRLKEEIPLQCDATIQYLLPSQKELLTENDLKIDSPYNTYLHLGLPPGPIGNPGLEAIKAALSPASVPYLYYVARGNGGHIFSVTYAEHLRAVEKYSEWLKHRSHD